MDPLSSFECIYATQEYIDFAKESIELSPAYPLITVLVDPFKYILDLLVW